MSRTRFGFAAVFGGTLLLAAFFASGWYVPVPGARTGVLPCLGAAAVILANSFGLSLIGTRFSARPSGLIPFIYIALVAANPATLRWTPCHPASLLLIATIYCYLRFCSDRSNEYLAASCLLLGTAGLFMPPIFWLFPLFLLMGAGRASSKGRGLATALIGLVLPLLFYGGILYLRQGADAALALPARLWDGMTEVNPGIPHFRATTLARILLTLAATLIAFFDIVRKLNTYKIVEFLAFVRLIILTAALCLLTFLFAKDNHTACAVATCLPITLLLNEYLAGPGKARTKTALAVATILLLVAERISLLL